MQEFHNNYIQDYLLSTTISTRFELETRGWSQIQAEEKIFPNYSYFLKIDQFFVEIQCFICK